MYLCAGKLFVKVTLLWVGGWCFHNICDVTLYWTLDNLNLFHNCVMGHFMWLRVSPECLADYDEVICVCTSVCMYMYTHTDGQTDVYVCACACMCSVRKLHVWHCLSVVWSCIIILRSILIQKHWTLSWPKLTLGHHSGEMSDDALKWDIWY